MKTYYYLGWFSNFFPEQLGKAIQEDITDRASLVMISANPRDEEDEGAAELSWLHKAGIAFEEVHLIDYRMQKEDALRLLHNASVIFLLGGDTLEQNAFLKEYTLADGIKRSAAVVMGASAGAINMSAKWLASRNFGYDVEASTVCEGIGLHNFSVLSHFDLENNMARVQDELALLSEEIDIYASNKDCALRVKGDQIDIFGDVYLLSRSVIRKLDETLQGRNGNGRESYRLQP